jgi:isoleucyl-tRNA synthetase
MAANGAKLLRQTLQLPATTFPMRANAAQREKEYVQRTTTQLYRWMREIRNKAGVAAAAEDKNSAVAKATAAAAEPFELHDGPPYANGGLHTGHLLNKVIIRQRKQATSGNEEQE